MTLILDEKEVETVPKTLVWTPNERLRRICAEAIGTYAIVFAAGAANIAEKISGGAVGLVGEALVSGMTVMAMIFTLGHICNAHFNPAVTIAFSITKHFAWREVPGYIIGQLAGAIAAAVTLLALFGNINRLGANRPGGDPMQALFVEVIITFVLMFVIMAVATDARAVGTSAAIAIGVTVAANILVAGVFSGGSMNPARTFGPALVSGNLEHNWVYWLGPIPGATLGALVYQFLRGERN
jgi:aquaporin NIP